MEKSGSPPCDMQCRQKLELASIYLTWLEANEDACGENLVRNSLTRIKYMFGPLAGWIEHVEIDYL